jgi:hypothetical protein
MLQWKCGKYYMLWENFCSPSARNNLASIGRIFIRLNISVFFENLSSKLKFGQNLTGITGTLQEDVCTLTTISRSILPRMRNTSDKCCREKKNLIFDNVFSQIVPLWDHVEKCGTAGQATDDNTIWRMRNACWIPEATDTHWECVIDWFSMATMVTRMRLNVTSYVHCLSCYHPFARSCCTVERSNWQAITGNSLHDMLVPMYARRCSHHNRSACLYQVCY